MLNKKICGKCNKNRAVWCYLPGYSDDGSQYFCDDCVHRGCSCNEYSVVADHYHPPGGIHPSEEDGIEGIDWKWKNEEKTIWARIDEKGRYYPCCEYDYDEDNFDWDEE